MEHKKHGTPQAAITTRSPRLHDQYTRNRRIPAIGSVVVENLQNPPCSHLPTGGHHRRTMPTYGEVLLVVIQHTRENTTATSSVTTEEAAIGEPCQPKKQYCWP